jgi:hypothetical protein
MAGVIILWLVLNNFRLQQKDVGARRGQGTAMSPYPSPDELEEDVQALL